MSKMTLAERLRELGFSGNDLGHEAADEIERLTGTLKRQIAWLIEWPEDDNVPVRWWHCKDGWVRDANKATWFVRESDAASFINSHVMVGCVKATEHVFLSTLPQPEPRE